MNSQLRRDPINRNWVILAPKRQERPNEFHRPESTAGGCPFCPGNEAMTPPEVASIREVGHDKPDSPDWKARVFPNLFPALTMDSRADFTQDDLYVQLPGVGGHEVIVLTPDHNLEPFEIDADVWFELLKLFCHRYCFWQRHDEIQYVLLFQNYGRSSGASLFHAHNQLVSTTIVPPRIEDELRGDREYFAKTGGCAYCEALERELSCARRIIFTNEHFVALCPFASRLPYESVLLPKRHSQGLHDLTETELRSLAHAMKDLLAAYAYGLDNPPFNYLFHVAPVHTDENADYFHWHLEFIPRLSVAAGFEWGSGIFINSVDPDDAASRLREGLSGKPEDA